MFVLCGSGFDSWVVCVIWLYKEKGWEFDDFCFFVFWCGL